MPAFDFHCHPTLKPLFVKQGEEPTPWEHLNVNYIVGKIFGNEIKLSINALVNETLNSQSNFAQLCGHVQMIGLILHAPESHMGKGLLERKMVADGKLDLLNADKLRVIEKGDHYFSWMSNELQFLKNNLLPPAHLPLPAGARAKILNSAADFDHTATNTVHCVLIIEGLHGFFNDPQSANAMQEFRTNFENFTSANKIFAVNLTHLQQMPFSNHASGMQFLKEELFYPQGNSISADGDAMVDAIYSKGILIDTKHMGLVARTKLYALRSQKNYTLPIICTHAGLTGIRFKERLNYLFNRVEDKGNVWAVTHLKKMGHVKFAAFNMTSINLFDEDVEEILKSDGLIGISLDQRILGFPTEHVAFHLNVFPSDTEFISKNETLAYFGPHDPKLYPENIQAAGTLSGDDVSNQESFDFATVHAHYFMNQVIHILKLGTAMGMSYDNVKTKICLGSDFDGLINAIDCCKDATQFERFKQILRDITTPNSFWSNTGFKKSDIDMEELLELIFFSNGVNFVKKHLG
jgi:microsomal dipeptidase-like Zn-dependent dipeptidase